MLKLDTKLERMQDQGSLAMKFLTTICFALLPSIALSDEFPATLFGIEIGKTYDVGSDNKGDLPVKKFRGASRFMGEGMNYYFEPLKDYSSFAYIEKKKNATDEFFETSFRMYLHPVVDDKVTDFDQLSQISKYVVELIEWSDVMQTEEAGYFWAFSMCERFAANLDEEPVVYEEYKKNYECIFKGNNARLEVKGNKRVSLALWNPSSRFEENSKAVRSLRLKLEFEEVNPY